MAMTESIDLMESMMRLFPGMDHDNAIAEMLLERAQRNLVRYQSANRTFANRYGQDFDAFRKQITSSEPDEATEQDYFDWELAVTGISDMQEEIGRLHNLIET